MIEWYCIAMGFKETATYITGSDILVTYHNCCKKSVKVSSSYGIDNGPTFLPLTRTDEALKLTTAWLEIITRRLFYETPKMLIGKYIFGNKINLENQPTKKLLADLNSKLI